MPATITDSKSADAVTLGLGILGISVWPAGSPATFTDVGYIKKMTATYSRELKEFESGGVLVKRLAFRDRFTFDSDWAEVSITNMQKLIEGDGGANDLKFGGDRTIHRYALRFEHLRDDGKYVTLDMYKSIASGEFSLAFAEEEFITYPTQWSAEADTTHAAGERYGKITIAT